jgi:hypothetical protein
MLYDIMPSVVMLNVVMLNAVVLNVIMLNVVMLGVIMLGVIMLIVIMPECHGASVGFDDNAFGRFDDIFVTKCTKFSRRI